MHSRGFAMALCLVCLGSLLALGQAHPPAGDMTAHAAARAARPGLPDTPTEVSTEATEEQAEDQMDVQATSPDTPTEVSTEATEGR